MKSKIKFIIISILLCLTFSALMEIFIFNFNSLTSKNDNPNTELSYTTEKNDKQEIINIDLNNERINKLIINYQTQKDIEYTISYTSPNLYNSSSETVITDIFDDSFTSSITNINSNVTKIQIAYNTKNNSDIKINKIEKNNSFYFNCSRFFFIFLSFILIVSIIYFYKSGFKDSKLHIYFVFVCIILGTMTIIAQPNASFYSFDDQIHFQKTVDWFGGNIDYSTGEYHNVNVNIDNAAGRESINSLDEQIEQDNLFNTKNNLYPHSAGYLPSYDKIPYLPMAIGYNLTKLLGLPFSICFIIGKLFNLLTFTLLMAYAIKIIKYGKHLLTVIALLPINIFLASQYSYDPIVLAGITIFIAKLLNLCLDKETKFDFKNAIILISSISLACFAKAIYAPLLLLTLFIPKVKFISQKQSRLVKAGLIGIMLVLMSIFILPTLSGTAINDSRVEGTSINDQLSLIVSHPLDFLSLLGNTAGAQFGEKLISPEALGDFAYIDNSVFLDSMNLYFLILAAIVFAFFTNNSNNTLSKKQRIGIICTNIFIIILIWTALYLSFNPVGNDRINGVQSRYFLPLLFPLLISIQPKNIQNKISPKISNLLIIATPTIVMAICIYTSILVPYSF